jgi:glycine cleavage system aminomethyltransferase T
MIERYGWMVAASFPVTAETASQQQLSLVDVSALAKFRLLGAGVPSAVQALLPGRSPTGIGQAAWLPGNEKTLLCRLREDHALLLDSAIAGPGTDERLRSILTGSNFTSSDATTTYGGFYLAGPIEAVLSRLTAYDFTAASFTAGACIETNFAGVTALLVREPTNPAALRVYVAWDLAEYVWETIFDSQPPGSVRLLGLEEWQARFVGDQGECRSTASV